MSGTVNFSIYPSTNRVPGVFFEVDASQANTGQINQRTLIVGQMLTAGTAIVNEPLLSTGIGDANVSYGYGSMLANMLTQYRLSDAFGEVWCLPLADDPAAAAGVGTITVAGTASANGTLNLYVAGVDVQVGVSAGDIATAVATNIGLAVTSNHNLPVTVAVAGAVVTVTAKNKGQAAADFYMRLNYLGMAGGEVTPAGLTLTFVQSTGGVTDPNPTAAFANLSDTAFDFIVFPYTGASQLTAVETLLSDASGRWSYVSELFGGAFSAYRGTNGALTTFGTAQNNQHVSILGFLDSPTPAYLVAADYGATCAASLRVDPALPLQNIVMNWLAPIPSSRFTFQERNTLLYSGISTFRVNDANQVILERACTTYQYNLEGGPDDSYLDVETLYTLMYLIRDLRTDLQTKYARRKLVADGTTVPYGANFVTSTSVKNECIANYRKNAALALCQNPDQFATQIVAENAGNGQVSILAPFQLANQLRVIAVLAQFTKP